MRYKKGKDYLANGMIKKFYTVNELATKLDTTVTQIRTLLRRGLPYIEISSNDYRYDIDAINDWLDENFYSNEKNDYLTAKEMLQYYGFGTRLLKRFRREGMPSFCGGHGSPIKYNPELTQTWISAHYSKRRLV